MRTLDGSQRIWFGFSWRKVATGARPLSETLGECALIFLHCVNTCSTLFSGTLTGIIPQLQHVDEQLCALVPQRKRLEQQWILMHTQLAPLSKWDIISRYPSQAGRPTLILLWLVCCEEQRRRGVKRNAYNPSALETNESRFFLSLHPRWDDPSSRARDRLMCHSVIEKLHRDDKKHRQLQLPAQHCQPSPSL